MRLVVDTQGAKLRKVGERLLVQVDGETKESLPLNLVEQLVLTGRGVQATTPLLYDLVGRGIDVVYQNQGERFAFRLVGPFSKHSALRVAQIRRLTQAHPALRLARAIIAGKLNNQAVILRRYAYASEGAAQARLHNAVQLVQTALERAKNAEDADSLRGYEGSGAAAYFAAWPALFDVEHWGFAGRAYYPPPDPINALLSLGYTLLLNAIVSDCYRIGLDPDVGCFHTLNYGRPSLALDLEEEFRPIIVDALVLALVRQDLLQPGDFRKGRGQHAGATMTDDARRFFMERYEARLAIRVHHPAQQQHLTLRQCITRQVEHMARCIDGRDAEYVPLMM
jgi:CRISPR-associated protein Cas1